MPDILIGETYLAKEIHKIKQQETEKEAALILQETYARITNNPEYKYIRTEEGFKYFCEKSYQRIELKTIKQTDTLWFVILSKRDKSSKATNFQKFWPQKDTIVWKLDTADRKAGQDGIPITLEAGDKIEFVSAETVKHANDILYPNQPHAINFKRKDLDAKQLRSHFNNLISFGSRKII